MEIKAGIGVGAIRFGIERAQVEAILGKPDEIEHHEEEGTVSWHYDELDLSLAFDQEEGWKLVTMAVTDAKYTYEDKSVLGMSYANFKAFIKPLIFGEMIEEDYSTNETPNHLLIDVDELSMNFWFEGGALSEVQWSPLFDDEEMVIWPNQE